MISEKYILFFKASLTIRHIAMVSQKKSGTSKKIQWDFQISRVGSLDFLDLKVNGSPVAKHFIFFSRIEFNKFQEHECWILFIIALKLLWNHIILGENNKILPNIRGFIVDFNT